MWVFLGIIVEPVDGKGDWVSRSFFGDAVDEWLNENVDMGGDVLFNFQLLLFHEFIL